MKNQELENPLLTQKFIKTLNKSEKEKFIYNTLMAFVTSIKLNDKPVKENGEVDKDKLNDILLEFHAKFIMLNESIIDKYFYYTTK